MAKETSGLRETRRWKAFLLGKPKDVLADHRDDVDLSIGLAVATLCTFARSCFRIAELSQGFSGPLANDEITFMVGCYRSQLPASSTDRTSSRPLKAQ